MKYFFRLFFIFISLVFFYAPQAQAFTLGVQAESSSLTSPMVSASDSNASGGQFVWVPEAGGGVIGCCSGGLASFIFNAPAAGDYYIWGRALTPSGAGGADDSFYADMDGGTQNLWDTAQSASWTWDLVNNRGVADPVVFTLSAGSHTLNIYQREDGAQLDCVLITDDPAFVPTAASDCVSGSPPPSGLTAWWKFDESSGTTAADSSGNGNTGMLTNGPTWTAGKIGQALNFDGVNDFVDLGNPASLQFTGSMTISAWIKSSSFPADDAAVVSKKGSVGFQMDTSVDTGQRVVRIKISDPSSSTVSRYGSTVLQPNTWYYETGVYDAINQTLKIYLNGVLDNGILSGTVPSSQLNSTENVNIGQRPGSGGSAQFIGTIDDPRVYNRALSAAEILALYIAAPPSGLTAWWKFDETSGTTAADSSGNGNIGILSGGTNWVGGKIGGAISLDGSTGIVTAPHIPFDNRSFSVSAWIKVSTTNVENNWFEQTESLAQNKALHLLVYGSGTLRFGFYTNDLDTASGVTPTDQWQNIVMTYDNATRARNTYVNAALRANDTANPYLGTTGSTIIGRNVHTPTEFFNGLIDEVCVFNKVLSSAEVQGVFNNGCGTGTITTGDITVNATLDGAPWVSGALGWLPLRYTITGPETIDGLGVPATYPSKPTGLYTITYTSGGPVGAVLDGANPYSPIQSQTLIGGTAISFTINFVSGSATCGNGTVENPPENCDAGSNDTVGWWKFDEGSGNVASDSSGRNNLLTISDPLGNSFWTTGKLGQAYNFKSATVYAFNPNVPQSPGTDNWTASAWIKTTENYMNIMFQNASGNSDRYGLTISGGKANFIANSGSGSGIATGATIISDSNWHLLTGIRNGPNSIAVYVDGALEASGTFPSGDSSIDTNTTFYVGGSPLLVSGGIIIDDVRLYNRALSAAEINNLYSLGLGGATCTSLGYTSGTLSCTSSCTFDESQCVLSLIDLQVTGLLVPGGKAGTAGTASVTIKNNGTQATPSSFKAGLRDGDPAGGITCSNEETGVTTAVLGAGASRTVDVPFTYPATQSTYTAYAMADADCAISESDETNNTASVLYSNTEDYYLLSVNTSSLYATVGGSGAIVSSPTIVQASPVNGFNDSINLTASVPTLPGATASFSNPSVGPTSIPGVYATTTLKVTVPANTADGAYAVHICGQDATAPFLPPRCVFPDPILNVKARDPFFKEVMREIRNALANTLSIF